MRNQEISGGRIGQEQLTRKLSIAREQIFPIVFCAIASQLILVLTNLSVYELIDKLKGKALENISILVKDKGMQVSLQKKMILSQETGIYISVIKHINNKNKLLPSSLLSINRKYILFIH